MITLNNTRRVAERKAEEIGQPMNIARTRGMRSNLHYSITNYFLNASIKIINIDYLRCKLHPPTPVPYSTQPPLFQHFKERLVRLFGVRPLGLQRAVANSGKIFTGSRFPEHE